MRYLMGTTHCKCFKTQLINSIVIVYSSVFIVAISVLLCGLDNAGKTTALYRMKYNQYCETTPTVGFNCEKVKGKLGKSKDVHFTIWDVGGQDKVRPLWRTYAKGAQAIMFVVDSSDHESMEEAKMEIAQVCKYHEIGDLPILILANKQDLPGAMDLTNLYQQLNVKDLSLTHLCKIVCACAITGDGLDEALESLYEMIVKKQKLSKSSKR